MPGEPRRFEKTVPLRGEVIFDRRGLIQSLNLSGPLNWKRYGLSTIETYSEEIELEMSWSYTWPSTP